MVCWIRCCDVQFGFECALKSSLLIPSTIALTSIQTFFSEVRPLDVAWWPDLERPGSEIFTTCVGKMCKKVYKNGGTTRRHFLDICEEHERRVFKHPPHRPGAGRGDIDHDEVSFGHFRSELTCLTPPKCPLTFWSRSGQGLISDLGWPCDNFMCCLCVLGFLGVLNSYLLFIWDKITSLLRQCKQQRPPKSLSGRPAATDAARRRTLGGLPCSSNE